MTITDACGIFERIKRIKRKELVSTFSQLSMDEHKFAYVVLKPVSSRQRTNLFEYASRNGNFTQRQIAQMAKLLFTALDQLHKEQIVIGFLTP